MKKSATRRDFIGGGVVAGLAAGAVKLGAKEPGGAHEEEEVSPAEDLMREHGF